jgi:hypothetical protein
MIPTANEQVVRFIASSLPNEAFDADARDCKKAPNFSDDTTVCDWAGQAAVAQTDDFCMFSIIQINDVGKAVPGLSAARICKILLACRTFTAHATA